MICFTIAYSSKNCLLSSPSLFRALLTRRRRTVDESWRFLCAEFLHHFDDRVVLPSFLQTLENSEKISSQNLFFFPYFTIELNKFAEKMHTPQKNKESSQKNRNETLRCCVLAALEHILVWYVENSLCVDHNLVEKPTTRTWLRLRHHNRTVQKQREIYQRGR